MATRWRKRQMDGVVELTTRYAAWLRLPTMILLVLTGIQSSAAGHWYYVVLALYVAWATARLSSVYRHALAGAHGAMSAAVVDVVAVAALSVLSGGPDSQARYAFYVLPMTSILWQLPKVTAKLGGLCLVAYTANSFDYLLGDLTPRFWQVVADEAFLLWDVGVCVLIADLLRRRSERVSDLLDNRELLLRDALAAEGRERAELAEALHDSAIQNLLAALHDLEDIEAEAAAPALARAENEVRRTVREIRDVTFDLHPQVLQAAGLAAALEAVGERLARRGGFTVHYDLRLTGRVPGEVLLYSTARELLNNVVKHAGAKHVWVSLAHEENDTVLIVRDDGKGFDKEIIQQRLRAGHIGLASHYVRVESAGGRFSVDSAPGRSTTVEVRLPYAHVDR
ncbi:ATP-binding protein [Streptomyces olivoreticuli]